MPKRRRKKLPKEMQGSGPLAEAIVATDSYVATKLKVLPSRECCRNGNCCRVILLGMSPAELRNNYNRWNYKLAEGIPVPPIAEIHLIWPMVMGTCRGKWTNPYDGTVRYVYGPCHHLTTEKVGRKTVAACAIHPIRPGRCSGYPYYNRPPVAEMSANGKRENPGYMRGCGFNEDPKAGFRMIDFRKVEPLKPEEM